jgi:sugar/nucleoside kinase (ribokinase family)
MTTHPPIIGLGMACLDILIRLKDMPTWERGARLDAMANRGRRPGGDGAVAAARLGVPTGFVGTYAATAWGRFKLQTLLEHGWT